MQLKEKRRQGQKEMVVIYLEITLVLSGEKNVNVCHSAFTLIPWRRILRIECCCKAICTPPEHLMRSFSGKITITI